MGSMRMRCADCARTSAATTAGPNDLTELLFGHCENSERVGAPDLPHMGFVSASTYLNCTLNLRMHNPRAHNQQAHKQPCHRAYELASLVVLTITLCYCSATCSTHRYRCLVTTMVCSWSARRIQSSSTGSGCSASCWSAASQRGYALVLAASTLSLWMHSLVSRRPAG